MDSYMIDHVFMHSRIVISNTQLLRMIPFSSQTSKFKGIYNKKMQKYHRCDTIVFGEVLGPEKAFLIQNMCPITEKYMKNEYLDSVANIPVRVDGKFENKVKTFCYTQLAVNGI